MGTFIAFVLLLGAVAYVIHKLASETNNTTDTHNNDADAESAEEVEGPGYDVDIVGESHYQQAIEALAGGRHADGVKVEKTATLILDNLNRYDKQAVAVEIDGRKVGHLSRENARIYREHLKESGDPNRTVSCPALICGGWDRGSDDRGHFGVKLDLSDIVGAT